MLRKSSLEGKAFDKVKKSAKRANWEMDPQQLKGGGADQRLHSSPAIHRPELWGGYKVILTLN